jgi:hypothetical protein
VTGTLTLGNQNISAPVTNIQGYSIRRARDTDDGLLERLHACVPLVRQSRMHIAEAGTRLSGGSLSSLWRVLELLPGGRDQPRRDRTPCRESGSL